MIVHTNQNAASCDETYDPNCVARSHMYMEAIVSRSIPFDFEVLEHICVITTDIAMIWIGHDLTSCIRM